MRAASTTISLSVSKTAHSFITLESAEVARSLRSRKLGQELLNQTVSLRIPRLECLLVHDYQVNPVLFDKALNLAQVPAVLRVYKINGPLAQLAIVAR